jgi:hypothetical protein
MDSFSPPCPHCGTPALYPTSPGSFYCRWCNGDFDWEEAKDAQRQREDPCALCGHGRVNHSPTAQFANWRCWMPECVCEDYVPVEE